MLRELMKGVQIKKWGQNFRARSSKLRQDTVLISFFFCPQRRKLEKSLLLNPYNNNEPHKLIDAKK